MALRTRARAFTLVELLVVIAIIGILIALLLPAIQAARETARRAQCSNNLVQLILAVNSYELSHGKYPPGVIEPTGPIQSVPVGTHRGWITQLLPYIEYTSAYDHIDESVGVYHAKNAKVRDLPISMIRCPSSGWFTRAYSNYAGLHHDVEAPIDVDNHGIFYLNSSIGAADVFDGTSHTLFIGEKPTLKGDLGWMSGTRATLRNTGTRINEVFSKGRSGLHGPQDVPSKETGGGDVVFSTDIPLEPDSNTTVAGTVGTAAPAGALSGPAAVGGFASNHPGGANFAFGDGQVRYVADTINMRTYQQLGHRSDGQLMEAEY